MAVLSVDVDLTLRRRQGFGGCNAFRDSSVITRDGDGNCGRHDEVIEG